VSSHDPFIISTGFDIEVLTLGKWDLEDRNKFHEWTDLTNKELKQKKAGELLTYFISKLLGEDCSYEARSKIQHLYNVVSNLENLVYVTRDIKNKYYRDHINHSLKVTLLSKAISLIEPFKLNENDTRDLLLSSLFHDIAYPLSDSVKIFDTTINALKDCYFSAEFFRSSIKKSTITDMEKLSEIVELEEDRLNSMIEDMNHGVLSAIEFISYLKNPDKSLNKYNSVIKSIALHNSEYLDEIDISKDPILGILLLSDELQDWGRTSVISSSIISRIEDFILEDRVISGRFPYLVDPNYSILKQICGKSNNIKKIIIDSKDILFKLLFELKDYYEVNNTEYVKLLQELYNELENKDDLDPEQNKPFYELKTYEMMTYGINTSDAKKMLIYNLLSKNKLNNSLLKDYRIYLNDIKKEIIISKYDLQNMDGIIFHNEGCTNIQSYIQYKKCAIKCNIFDENNIKTKEIYDIFITIIRYINYLNYIISGTFDALRDKNFKIEGSCNYELLTIISKITTIPNYINRYNNLRINLIIESMRKGNFFLFSDS